MSEYDEFDDNMESDDSGLPSDLRKQIKARDKQIATLRKELEEAAKAVSDFKVRDVLNERGLTDKRALRLLKADGVDAGNAEAVDAWLSENGDLFGYTPQSDDRATETAQALQAMSNVEARGVPTNSVDELRAQIQGAKDENDLTAIIAANART